MRLGSNGNPKMSGQHLLYHLVSRCSSLRHLLQTHGFMVPRAMDRDNLLLAQFLHHCSSLGYFSYVLSFLALAGPPPDIYLYNSAIRALSLSSSPKHAIFLFRNIQPSGLRPDSYSFPFALKAVVKLSALLVGTQIHGQVTRSGFDSHVSVVTALVQMYSACVRGCVSNARKLFDGIRADTRDVALWNAMLSAYVRFGDLHAARGLFEIMPKRNVISWTALITGYAQANWDVEAITLFRRMQFENVEPDEVALLVALSACAHLGALELGEWIHSYVDKHRLPTTLPLSNALIDMYAKSGNIFRALQVFENIKDKSVVTWTTMIAGLALHGLGREALEMFSRMEITGVRPNAITFIGILSACSHVGLVQIGQHYFRTMTSNYGIEPKIEHYGCMVDLLGRAGYLQEAQELLREMPFEPNAAIWGSLLAASNTHANARLGELALRHLIKLEPNNSGNYSILSNIYSSLGKWSESQTVRTLMRDKGVKKISGGSSIEVNSKVHEFISGGPSHPQFDRICEVLCELNLQFALHTGYLQKKCGKRLIVDEE